MRSTDDAQPVTRGAGRAHAASLISYVISPVVLPPVLFALVLLHFGAPAAEIGRTLTVVIVLFVGVPLGYVLLLVRRRRVPSIELADPAHRTAPFLVGATCAALAAGLLAVAGGTAATLVAALAALHAVNTLLATLVTRWWKISVHALAAGGFVASLLFVALTAWPVLADRPAEALLLRPAPLTALLGLVPLVMWARVRRGAHTPAQVAAGAALGLAVPYAELWALRHLGVL